MTNANTAREMTNQAINNYKTKRMEEAKTFCDTILDEEIQKASKDMTSLVIIRFSYYPEVSTWDYVAQYLKENGFSVNMEKANSRLEISW